ncbi:MAG: hypothetical protein JRC87_12175 [Deltaproteobacteria bacterium]|nr:hypothetical protein [Deltaproteobacteria bacterium]
MLDSTAEFREYTVTLKVRYSDFSTITRSRTLRTPIYSSADILFQIPSLLNSTEAGRRKVRLLGISISNLTTDKKSPIQLLLPFPGVAEQPATFKPESQAEVVTTS